MRERAVDADRRRRPQSALFSSLYRQAAKRWILLAVALGLLVALGVFAGRVRNPDAVKRRWAVVASRVLAAAGGFFVVRLLLFSYEERIPVLLFALHASDDAGSGVDTLTQAFRRFRRQGVETVPLRDIIEFVRDRRYVPRKAMGIVIEAESILSLTPVLEDLPDIEITALLPPEALAGPATGEQEEAIPAGVSLGVSLAGGPLPHDAAGLTDLLEGLRKQAVAVTGREPEYVRVGPSPGIELRGLLKNTPYVCFLDGSGFNRFGDEPHMLRLIDAAAVTGGRRAGARLSTYVGLFKGKYYLWPAAAFLRLSAPGPEGE